jgi:hypothetical protein
MSDDVKSVMIEVAQAIANRAKAADQPPFAEQIDALKALTAMYTALRKHPDDSNDDAGDGFDFSKGVQADADEDPPDERTTVTPIRTRRRPG